jgi:hypothetical protein
MKRIAFLFLLSLSFAFSANECTVSAISCFIQGGLGQESYYESLAGCSVKCESNKEATCRRPNCKGLIHGYCKCLDLPFVFKKTFLDKIHCSGVWVENQTLRSETFTIEPNSSSEKNAVLNINDQQFSLGILNKNKTANSVEYEFAQLYPYKTKSTVDNILNLTLSTTGKMQGRLYNVFSGEKVLVTKSIECTIQ